MNYKWFQALQEIDAITAYEILPWIELERENTTKNGECANLDEWLKVLKTEPDAVLIPAASMASALPRLLQHFQEAHFCIMDKNPARMAAGLNAIDSKQIADAITEKRLAVIVGGPHVNGLKRFSEVIQIAANPSIKVLDTVVLDDLEHSFAREYVKIIRQSVRRETSNVRTRSILGSQWQVNTLRNIPAILKGPGIKRLTGLFKGKPALVIAAGPSLDLSLPEIKKLEERFVIICVGNALRPVLKYGIRPDLVISVDGKPVIIKQFDSKHPDLYLISSFITDPEVLARFDKTFFGYCTNNTIGKWLNQAIKDRGELFTAGTVTATALDIAARMGCTPIISAGMDLSYAQDGLTHAANTQYHNQKIEELPDTLVEVPGNFRKKVVTNSLMAVYIELISSYLQDIRNIKELQETRFINLNSDGALIEGMELCNPSQLETLASYTPLHSYDIIAQAYEEGGLHKEKEEEACVQILDKVRDQLRELILIAVDGAMICNSTMLQRRKASEAQRSLLESSLEKLGRLDEQLLAHPAMPLIEMSLYSALHELSRQEIAKHEKNTDPAMRSLRRSRLFYQNVAGAARWTEALIKQTVEQIKTPFTKESKSNKQPVPAKTLT